MKFIFYSSILSLLLIFIPNLVISKRCDHLNDSNESKSKELFDDRPNFDFKINKTIDKDVINMMPEFKNVTNNSIGFANTNQENMARIDNQLYENDRYLFNVIITISSIFFAFIIGIIVLLLCYCRIYKKKAKKSNSITKKKSTANTSSNSSQNRINSENNNDNNNIDNISMITNRINLGNQSQRPESINTNLNINDHVSVYIDLDSPEIDRNLIINSRNVNDLPSYNEIFLKNYQFV